MSLFGAVWKEKNHDDGLMYLKNRKNAGSHVRDFLRK